MLAQWVHWSVRRSPSVSSTTRLFLACPRPSTSYVPFIRGAPHSMLLTLQAFLVIMLVSLSDSFSRRSTLSHPHTDLHRHVLASAPTWYVVA